MLSVEVLEGSLLQPVTSPVWADCWPDLGLFLWEYDELDLDPQQASECLAPGRPATEQAEAWCLSNLSLLHKALGKNMQDMSQGPLAGLGPT